MRQIIQCIILENEKGQRLRIYKVEGSDTFCIGTEGEDDHFEFTANAADDICNAISRVIES